MKTVSQRQFSRTPTPKIPRSVFDRSSPYKTTFDAGFMCPIFVDEALPGDTFTMRANFFCRLNTPIYPILDNAVFETLWYEVPYRQVWDNWAKFNGEQDNPGDSTDYLIPTLTSDAINGFQVGSIADFFGIPTDVPNLEVNALPFRCVNHIFNEWIRDQNLQNSLPVPKDDGPDSPLDYQLFRRGKRPDYFTTSLPWPQKSDSGSVQLPLGTSAPITSDATTGDVLGVASSLGGNVVNMDSSTAFLQLGVAGTPNLLYADLSEATAATINQFRQSAAIQQIFERDARGGTRLIEVVEAHFGVRSPDLRLQRPGFLGGGRSALNISPIAQTQASDPTTLTPQGNLAAIGTISGGNHSWSKSFTEHTFIIGFCVVRADLTYQRGLHKMWQRRTRFDHYWPALANIGEQAVLRSEIFADGTANDDIVFGYQERNAEYRYAPGKITGLFRSNQPQSLDAWHLSQDFQNAPVLGDAFIQEDPPFDRVVAVPTEPHFKLDAWFDLKCARPMPMFGVPGMTRI